MILLFFFFWKGDWEKTFCPHLTHRSLPVGDEISGRHHPEGGCPEPSVDGERLEPGLVAALHLGVAQSTGGVHVTDVGRRHQGLDKVLLLQRLKGDHVHAHLAAVVAAGEPVPAGVAQRRLVARPGDPVALAAEREVADCKKFILCFPRKYVF